MTILDEIEVAMTQKMALTSELIATQLPIQKKIDQVDEYILLKRADLEAHLKKNRVDKIHSTDGKWFFGRSVRHSRVIADETAVTTFLKENDLYQRYTKLDKVGIVSLAGKREIPGITIEEKEIFTLKEVKDSTEEIKPEESQREFSDRVRKSREA